MITSTQAAQLAQHKIGEFQANIDRLKPLAEAERRAEKMSHVNPWKGSTEQLHAAEAALKGFREKLAADAQAEEVRKLQNELGRRDKLIAELADWDAKLAKFDSEVPALFINTMRSLCTSSAEVPYPSARRPSDPMDWRGHPIDVSPKFNGKLIVPDDQWEAVKAYRETYIGRSFKAMELDTVNRSISGFVARNPALAYVQPRRAASS